MNRLVCFRWPSKTQRKENFSGETLAGTAKTPAQIPPIHFVEIIGDNLLFQRVTVQNRMTTGKTVQRA